MSQHARGVGEEAIEDEVARIVAAVLGRRSGGAGREDRLMPRQNGFDSFKLVELVLRLEAAFAISIPDGDLDPDVFHSIRSVAAYVRRRVETAG